MDVAPPPAQALEARGSSLPRQSAVAATGDAGSDPRTAWVIATLSILAAAMMTIRLFRPGGLMSGGSYDTSVELASAIRMVHGVLPYGRFVQLQPPGLLIVLSPFGLLSYLVGSRGALITLTICEPLLAAANVMLVGRLVRHRGWLAALWACLMVAIYPALYMSLQDGQLESIIDLICLIGLSIAFRGDRLAGSRRLVVGGAVIGFGASVLVSAVIPLLPLAALSARRIKARLLPVLGGALAGFAVPYVPFLAAAPSAVVHDTLLSAVQRAPGATRTPIASRISDVGFATPPAAAAAILGGLCVLIVVGMAWGRRPLSQFDWQVIGTTLLMTAAQFAIATYYPHYAAMLIPYIALLSGLGVGRLASLRWSPRLVPIVALAAALVAVGSEVVWFERSSWRDPAAAVDAVIPAGGCAMAEHTQFLVASDRLTSSLPGCPALVDPYGTTLAYAGDHRGLVGVFTGSFRGCNYVVADGTLRHWFGAAWEEPIRSYVMGHFRVVRSGNLNIWVREPLIRPPGTG